MGVIENIYFACNLTYGATVATIDTWLTCKDPLPNDAFLKRFKLIFNIVRRRSTFNSQLFNHSILDLTNTLVARSLLRNAIRLA